MSYLLNYRVCFYWALLIVSAVYVSLWTNNSFLANFNSDWVYVFSVASDMVSNKTIMGQDFPPASYFFPEVFVTGLLTVITRNVAILHFLYSLLFLGVYIVLVRNLLRACRIKDELVLLGVLFSFILYFLFLLPVGLPWMLDFQGSHTAVLLYGLYLLGSYVKNRQAEFNLSKLCLLFVLSYLLYVSDRLLLIQIFVPFAVLVIVDRMRGKNNKKVAIGLLLMLLLTVLVGTATPWLLTKYFHVTFSIELSKLFHVPSMEQIGQRITTFTSELQRYFGEHKAFYVTLIFYHTFAIVFFLGLIYRHCKSKHKILDNNNLITILLFLYLSQLCTLVAGVASGQVNSFSQFRYLNTLSFFPPIVLAFMLIFWLSTFTNLKIWLNLIFMIVFGWGIMFFVRHYPVVENNISLAAPYKDTIQCIDRAAREHNLKNGLAPYWSVRPNRLQSKENLGFSPISDGTDTLTFSLFSDNSSHLYTDMTKKIPRNYQFIITNNLKEDMILRSVGKPDNVVQCPGATLWLYNTKKSEKKLSDYMKRKLPS